MMKLQNIRRLALLTALIAAPGLQAAEVAGIRIDERLKVGVNELLLNGAGLRSKLFIKVYVGALYVTQKSSSPTALLDALTPSRMQLRLLRDLGADALHDALDEGLMRNNSPAELAALKPQAEQLAAILQRIGKVREGDVVAIDFSKEGVNVSLNGESRGNVAGAPFARALMKVWLGEQPVDAGLKKALLGA